MQCNLGLLKRAAIPLGDPRRASCVLPYLGSILKAHPETETTCRPLCTVAVPQQAPATNLGQAIGTGIGAIGAAASGYAAGAAAAPTLPLPPPPLTLPIEQRFDGLGSPPSRRATSSV